MSEEMLLPVSRVFVTLRTLRHSLDRSILDAVREDASLHGNLDCESVESPRLVLIVNGPCVIIRSCCCLHVSVHNVGGSNRSASDKQACE